MPSISSNGNKSIVGRFSRNLGLNPAAAGFWKRPEASLMGKPDQTATPLLLLDISVSCRRGTRVGFVKRAWTRRRSLATSVAPKCGIIRIKLEVIVRGGGQGFAHTCSGQRSRLFPGVRSPS